MMLEPYLVTTSFKCVIQFSLLAALQFIINNRAYLLITLILDVICQGIGMSFRRVPNESFVLCR